MQTLNVLSKQADLLCSFFDSFLFQVLVLQSVISLVLSFPYISSCKVSDSDSIYFTY